MALSNSGSYASYLGRLDSRRKQQIQRPQHPAIQAAEALRNVVQAEVDTHRNSGAEWTGGLVRTDLFIGHGPSTRPLHYSFSYNVLRSGTVECVSVDRKGGLVPAGNSASVAPDPPAVSRGPSFYARARSRGRAGLFAALRYAGLLRTGE